MMFRDPHRMAHYLLCLLLTGGVACGATGCATTVAGTPDLIWTPPTVSSPRSDPTPLTLSTLRIPAGHGKIKNVWEAGTPGPIILHIQDANAQYVAQKHEAAILDDLIRRHGLYLVLVEGGSRNDSLSYMRTYGSLEKRRQIAEQYLRQGRISGENYLDLATDHEFLVYGVETPELYDQGMKAWTATQQLQSEALPALRGFQRAIAALKERFYPPEVQALERQEQDEREGRLSYDRYVRALAKEARQQGIPIDESNSPNLRLFLKTMQFEEALDFRRVSTALGEIDTARGVTGTDTLRQQCADMDAGRLTPAEWHKALHTALTLEHLAKYPVLARYLEYLRCFSSINYDALSVEIGALSDRVKAEYFQTPEARELAALAKQLTIVDAMVNGTLTPEPYREFLQQQAAFQPEAWAEHLQRLGMQQHPPVTFALDPGPLHRAMPLMTRFYETVVLRARAMADNTLKRVEDAHVPFAVLITGGFHTPTLTEAFKARRVSYAVIAPTVGRITTEDTARYHKILGETYVPMSEGTQQHASRQSTTQTTAH